MATQGSRTLDLDKVFVREIVFKDFGNRPISSNKYLITRGDGGIYFGDGPNGDPLYRSFNEFRAGDIVHKATAPYNTLWLEAGAGIEFHSTLDGTQPKTYIAATGPEQIKIAGTNDRVHFSSLTDDPDGGRTLQFAALGDMAIHVSDGTVLFESAYISTYSSLVFYESTIEQLYDNQSTNTGLVNEALSTVNFYLLSTSIVDFEARLSTTETTVDYTSSFVFSTFRNDSNGDRTILQINTVSTQTLQSVSSLTQSLTTTVLNIGSNTVSDVNIQGEAADYCTVFTSNGVLSTFTNFTKIEDDYSGVTFAIEKERLTSQSTMGTSTLYTEAQQVQIGWFPTVSTLGGSVPPNIKEQFVPVLQQIQMMETATVGGVSSVVNFAMSNIAHLDKICATGTLDISAPTTISSLTVSTINGLSPYMSTFSTITVSSAFANTVTASSIYSQELAVSAAQISSLTAGDVQASTLVGDRAAISELTVSSILGWDPYRSTFSTIFISTGAAQTFSASSLTTSTFVGDRAAISELTVSSILGWDPYRSTFSTIFISTGAAQTFSASSLTASTFVGDRAAISELTVSSILGWDPYRSTFSTIFISTGAAQTFSASTIFISTGAAQTFSASTISMSTGAAQTFSASTIFISTGAAQTFSASSMTLSTGAAQTFSASTIFISTGAAQTFSASSLTASTFVGDRASLSELSVSSILGWDPYRSTFSTIYISSGFTTNMSISSLKTSTVQAREIGASTIRVSSITAYEINVVAISSVFYSSSRAEISSLVFTNGTGTSLSVSRLSTTALGFSTAVGDTAQVSTLSTGALYFSNAIGPHISAINISTAALGFSTATGGTLHASSISTTLLAFSSGTGDSLYITQADFSSITWSTARGDTAFVSSMKISTVMGDTAPIFTFDTANRRVGINLGLTQQPRATVDISGIVYANNFVTTSDRRLKHNIRPLVMPALEALPRAYRFAWETGEEDIGFMADEVEAIAPECVYTTDTGNKAVNYMKLVVFCFDTMRMMAARIDALQKN
jgi:hypothetical protein